LEIGKGLALSTDYEMNSERWREVKALFDVVVELPLAERKQFLEKSCGGDDGLRRDVENLLISYDDAESFMDTPAAAEVASLIIESKNLEAGKRFGHYEIIKQIGTGGMGEVYLAEDKKLDRRVAVKILNEQFSQNEANIERFIREAKAASSLNHPNILVIHEIGKSDNSNYIVSEFIEGKTLRQVIGELPMKQSEILDIAIQIVSALISAHDAHIVHRDIKPENIMIRPDGLVKILDFGIAKLIERKSQPVDAKAVTEVYTGKITGLIIGTANYMSPEQATGKAIDTRSDIFSFGIVLYEMIAGKPPFEGETAMEVIGSILNKEPAPLNKFLADVPHEIELIVDKTLEKDREERYQTAKDLLIDLKRFHRRLEYEIGLKHTSSQKTQAEKKTLNFKAETSQKTPTVAPNNLTGNLSPVVGREKEISRIKKLLRQNDVRLITMAGVGGTGKTRLAQAVAQEMLPDFSDGVFFVEMAAITNPELVASTIAQPLGVKEAVGRPILEALKEYLSDKQILLVVDNFEQVVDAAPQIAEILAIAANLKILITSRVLLHLSTEREFIVPPLAMPNEISGISIDELSNYEAIRLFVERVQGAKPNFALTDENANYVAKICARLDGLPLAIELAAARVKILSPRAILDKLENRLKLLTGGASDLPARQQTMRSAIEWSYKLLTEDEQHLFRQLAVFAGGFTFEAAEAVCNNYELQITDYKSDKNQRSKTGDQIEFLDLITSLVDKSLLVSKDQTDDEQRFHMLEVVREYALEFLQENNEAEAIRRSHAAYFLALAERAEPEMRGSRQPEWVERLDREHDNLRAVMAWSIEQETETGLRLGSAIRNFWQIRGYYEEGRHWLEAILKKSDGSVSLARAKVLTGAGHMARQMGDYKAALPLLEESLRISRATGNRKQTALSCRGLAMIHLNQNDIALARLLNEESLAIGRELSDNNLIALSLNSLGEVLRIQADYRTARELYEEALTLNRRSGYQQGLCLNLVNLGLVTYQEGDYEAARAYQTEALCLAQKLDYKLAVAASLDGCGALAVKDKNAKLAAQLAGSAGVLRENINHKLETPDYIFRENYLADARAALSKTAFSDAFEQGRNLKLEEAVTLCLEQSGSQAKMEILKARISYDKTQS
jgi:non-specific serine/threonine protein kinase